MPEIASDNFTGTANSLIGGRSTTTGSKTWTAYSQFEIVRNTGTINASNQASFSSFGVSASWGFDIGAADHYAEATIVSTGDHPRGVAVRVASDYDWIALRPYSSAYWAVTRCVGGSETVLAAIDSAGAGGILPAAGRRFKLVAEGSNPTVVKAYVMAAEGGSYSQIGAAGGYSISATDAPLLQGVTKVGIAGPGSAAIVLDNFATGSLAAADSITITSPENVVQANRSGNTNVSFSGTYSGSPTSIQARIVDFTTGTVISGLDWQTVVASPSGGTYSFSLAIPARANLRCDVRFSNQTTVTAQTGQVWGVGVCVAIFGQSNALGMQYGTVTPNTHCWYFVDNVYSKPTYGGVMALANKINELTNLPVAITHYGVGSTQLTDLLSGTNWSNFIAQVDGKATGFYDCLLIQGEADTTGTPTINGRKSTLDTLLSQMATAGKTITSTMKILIGQIGTDTSAAADSLVVSDGWETIRRADHEKCIESTAFDLAAHLIGVSHNDALHYDNAGYLEIGYRAGRSLAKNWGSSSYDGLGPKLLKATISNNIVRVYVDLNGHNSISGTTPLTGLQYSTNNGTTWNLVTGASVSSNVITFTAANTTHVRYLANVNPTLTNRLRGDLKADPSSAAGIDVAPTTGGYILPVIPKYQGVTAKSSKYLGVKADAQFYLGQGTFWP